MALIWIDGFETYQAGGGLAKRYLGASLGTSSIGKGRLQDSQAFVMAGTEFATPTFTSDSTWTIGFAFNNLSLPSGNVVICELRDGSTAQVDLRYNATTGKFTITRNGTVLGTTTNTFSGNAWFYVEWKTTVHATAGSTQLKVNEVLEIDLSGADQVTQVSVNSSANKVAFKRTGALNTQSYMIDDLYINDSTGGSNTSFLGDCKIEAIYPRAEGNSSDWTPSVAGGVNYSMITDNDSNYLKSSTTNNKDTYNFSNLRFVTTSIVAVSLTVFASNQDSQQHDLVAVSRIGGSDYDSTTTQTVSSTADQAKTFILTTNPATSSVWSASTINSAEFGFKLK